MTTPLGKEVLARLEGLLRDREARGVAHTAKITETHISKWRNGKIDFNPKLATLEGLAIGFGVPVGELVGHGPTFEERLASLTQDEKLALIARLVNEARGDRS